MSPICQKYAHLPGASRRERCPKGRCCSTRRRAVALWQQVARWSSSPASPRPSPSPDRTRLQRLRSRYDLEASAVTGSRPSRPRWLPPDPPTLIVIYPDPRNDRWRHALYYQSQVADGSLPVPGDALPGQAMQAAESMVADVVREYYDLRSAIDWHPPDAKGWITGDVRSAPRPEADVT